MNAAKPKYAKRKLRFPCPGNTCPKNQYIDWTHDKDGRAMYIDTDVEVFCGWCEDYTFIGNWEFKCNHKNHGASVAKWGMQSLQAAMN